MFLLPLTEASRKTRAVNTFSGQSCAISGSRHACSLSQFLSGFEACFTTVSWQRIETWEPLA